jgi:hypothetical protein
VWQETFAKYKSEGFTIVGLALDSEGIAPAKRYYDKYGVKFHALVDPNYATGFAVVPKTFFVNEHGVVQQTKGWEERLKPAGELQPVTDEIRAMWSEPGKRLDSAAIANLVAEHEKNPADLASAVELASRYLDLKLHSEARTVLQAAVGHYDAKQVSLSDDAQAARLLGQAYFQLARASTHSREDAVRYATLSFYLHPTVGFGKQIARIIAPEKFDGRPKGDFDNIFREGTLLRLRQERKVWRGEP